jgi:hypothetical protein
MQTAGAMRQSADNCQAKCPQKRRSMNIIVFFFRHSRKAIILSAAAGIISGISNAALLAVINSSL